MAGGMRMPIMAYSPIEQGRMLRHAALRNIAQRHGATPARVALAWVLRQPNVCAIPRTGNPEHTRDNAAAATLQLAGDDLAELDAAFPPPARKLPLEML
jgi:diketogulonate reductase-like aldo/keto reductase